MSNWVETLQILEKHNIYSFSNCKPLAKRLSTISGRLVKLLTCWEMTRRINIGRPISTQFPSCIQDKVLHGLLIFVSWNSKVFWKWHYKWEAPWEQPKTDEWNQWHDDNGTKESTGKKQFDMMVRLIWTPPNVKLQNLNKHATNRN